MLKVNKENVPAVDDVEDIDRAVGLSVRGSWKTSAAWPRTQETPRARFVGPRTFAFEVRKAAWLF